MESTLLKHLCVNLPLMFPWISSTSVAATRSGNNIDICTMIVDATTPPSKVWRDKVWITWCFVLLTQSNVVVISDVHDWLFKYFVINASVFLCSLMWLELLCIGEGARRGQADRVNGSWDLRCPTDSMVGPESVRRRSRALQWDSCLRSKKSFGRIRPQEDCVER